MPLEKTLEEVAQLDQEVENIKRELLRSCWYMRGGVTLDEMFSLGIEERKIISEIIKENIDITKESKLPFF